jgi:hypothetical protein
MSNEFQDWHCRPNAGDPGRLPGTIQKKSEAPVTELNLEKNMEIFGSTKIPGTPEELKTLVK